MSASLLLPGFACEYGARIKIRSILPANQTAAPHVTLSETKMVFSSVNFSNGVHIFSTAQVLLFRTRRRLLDKDTERVERARNGDRTAFKELVTGHKNNVYCLAYDLMRSREDAEDVSQDVFIKAYRSLESFRHDAKFSSWLYRITVNTCLSLKMKKSYSAMKTSVDLDDLETTLAEAGGPDPEKEMESGFIRGHLEKALAKLSQRERTIFIMRNESGMSFNEIVEILKIRPATARSFNFKALRKLRKELAFYRQEHSSEGL